MFLRCYWLMAGSVDWHGVAQKKPAVAGNAGGVVASSGGMPPTVGLTLSDQMIHAFQIIDDTPATTGFIDAFFPQIEAFHVVTGIDVVAA